MSEMNDTQGCQWVWSRHTGELVWRGPRHWILPHGPATLVFCTGDLEQVENCRLPSGERAHIKYDPFNVDAPARREGSAGLDGDKWPGDITIEAWDVAFVDRPELEDDLLNSKRVRELADNALFAENLYAALCNIDWFRDGYRWSTTWREAGRIVARLRGDETEHAYLRFYNRVVFDPRANDEGIVAAEVACELAALGWSWKRMAPIDAGASAAMRKVRRLALAEALDRIA